MKCYTYRLELIPDPRYYYFGARNIYRKPPESDGYFGSGTEIKAVKQQYGNNCFTKEVLEIFSDRQLCLLSEQQLVGDLWKEDPFCLNRMPGGAWGGRFDTTGLQMVSLGSQIRFVLPEKVTFFLNLGWEKGLPLGRKNKLQRQIVITDGEVERKIDESELDRYEAEGWKRGRSFKNLQELRTRVPIHSGSIGRSIQQKDLEQYLEKGWVRGHTEEHTKNSTRGQKGMVWIYSGSLTTKVKESEVLEKEQQGWVRGCIHNLGRHKSEKLKQEISNQQKGRVWIHNEELSKKVTRDQLDDFLQRGWKRGRRIS